MQKNYFVNANGSKAMELVRQYLGLTQRQTQFQQVRKFQENIIRRNKQLHYRKKIFSQKRTCGMGAFERFDGARREGGTFIFCPADRRYNDAGKGRRGADPKRRKIQDADREYQRGHLP